MFEEYEPSEDDIVWIRTVLKAAKNDAVLTIPTTRLIYKVNHVEKIVTLLNPDQLEYEDSVMIHRRVIRVLGKVGYVVLVREIK